MSSPLPLRLCCMAAMAPALTEAATQARIRLPSSPTASPTNSAVNGRDGINLSSSLTDCRSNRSQGSGGKGDVSLGPAKYITLKTAHLQNGGVSLKSHFTQFGSKSKVNLADLGVITNLPNLYKQERLREFTKNDKCQQRTDSLSNTMNQSNSINGRKDPSVSCADCSVIESSQVMGNENNTSPFSKCGRSNGLHGNEHKSSLATLKSVKSDSETSSQLKVSESEQSASLDNNCLEFKPPVTEGEDIVPNDTVPLPSSNCSGLQNGATQTQLERRVEYLLRRLRRLQAKQVQAHTKQQLNNYVAYQNRNLQVLSVPNEQAVPSENVKSDVWQSEDVKSLSTVALVSLVKKIQTSQSLGIKHIQTLPKPEPTTVLHLRKDDCEKSEKTASQVGSYLRHVESAFDSDATESSSGGESSDELNLLPEKERKNRLSVTPVHRRPEWKWAVDRAGVASRWTWLQAQVSDLEYRIRQQSDIYRQIRANKGTVVLGDPPQPEDLMAKSRLVPKPGRRLSPIEAKIANIEKKNEMSPCNISTLLCNVDKQSLKLVQSLGNCLSPSPLNSPSSTNGKLKAASHPRSMNGFVESRNSASEASDVDSPDCSVHRTPEVFRQKDSSDVTVSPAVDASCQAARCRPVKSYRKRKLLRTTGLQTNRKNARLSSVKCQCYPPMTCCAMCGGRYNSTRKLNPLVMHSREKISLLDTSTHPILSFPQDTPLPIHLEGAISAGGWQAKLAPKSKLSDRRRSKLAQLNERKTKRYARGVGLLSTTKYRRKLDNMSRPRNRSASLPTTPRKNRVDGRKCRTAVKRRRAAQLALAAIKRPYRSQSMSVASSHGSSGSGSRTPTPSPQTKDALLNSSILAGMKEAALRKKRGESAYDINNIVIPYSMAAATRVTRLKYKEIVTPKWRDITDPEGDEELPLESPIEMEVDEHQPTEAGDGPSHNPQEDSQLGEEDEEIEDCSDEAFTQRHMKCEGQEKKRFMSFVQYGRRVRGSRTESGANTPDHLSPECVHLEGQFVGAAGSLQDSGSGPPHTPSSKFFTPIPVREGRESKDNGFRKRSGSNSRRDRSASVDESSVQIEMEWVSADPWPLRTFPLGEEEMERMMAEQPSVEELRALVVEETAKTLMAAPVSTGVASVSRSSSPAPSTSTSLSEEDPNDPEWTVQCDNQPSMTTI